MVKAKEFWNYLCEELDYRFFAGVACPGLAPLYKRMSSNFMHYVPAANERIALGLASGAHVAGLKTGILIDMRFAYDLTSLFKFNIDYKIPLLVIGYNGEEEESFLAYDFPSAFIMGDSFKEDLLRVTTRVESEGVPGLINFERGSLEEI
jgi:sulfopyruvate decarboxylase TPP-binding subunit